MYQKQSDYRLSFSFNYLDQIDPDGTLQWLIEQLLDSEQKGEKAYNVYFIQD